MQDSYRCSTKAGSQSTNCAANCLQSHIFWKLNIFDNQIKSIQNNEHNQPNVLPIACNFNIFLEIKLYLKTKYFCNQINLIQEHNLDKKKLKLDKILSLAKIIL